jgi:5-methylcytosine-specific restriction endonuclease McrBC GTP-binding regulatory subunit McrB
MSINLLTYGISQIDIPKKIEKLNDVRFAFEESPIVNYIAIEAIEYLESQIKVKGEKSSFNKLKKSGSKSETIVPAFTSKYTMPINFKNEADKTNLYFSLFIIKRFIASLATKPFVIFTGLSGSGKTKLAQSFAKWICENEEQYKIIPVGADWTNREPILGYPNSLDTDKYVLPDNGALDLILAAMKDANDKELKQCKPYFLILDEMNLSHVERYFADFLSGMESKESISLYSGNDRVDENGRLIPKQIYLPSNLFIVGTVNIDETTYMFSPKVLDRANTIEFRVEKSDLVNFLDAPQIQSQQDLDGMGARLALELMEFVSKETQVETSYDLQLLDFFKALQPIGAEFGYRTANEMKRLIYLLGDLALDKDESALDVAVIQKLLPKLNGSRSKLIKVLPILATFCLQKNISNKSEYAISILEDYRKNRSISTENDKLITLKYSFAKIARMYVSASENGFASFAEG